MRTRRSARSRLPSKTGLPLIVPIANSLTTQQKRRLNRAIIRRRKKGRGFLSNLLGSILPF